MNIFKITIVVTMIQSNLCGTLLQQKHEKRRRVLTQAADEFQQNLYNDKVARLAVFEAQRQKLPGFLQKWESRERQSTVGIINAYRSLFQYVKESVTEEVVQFYEHPLNMRVLDDIRQNFSYFSGGYQYDFVRKQNIKLTDVIGEKPVQFGFDEPTIGQQDALQDHQKNLQERLQSNAVPYNYYREYSAIQNNYEVDAETKENWIRSLFNKYELDRTSKNYFDQDTLLPILVLLIMDLERMHPYLDYNCRTFAVLLLNKELIRHNMSPSILEDPNNFDFMTVEQMVSKVKEGQENYKQLVQTGVIHKDDMTDEQLIYSTKNEISGIIEALFCIDDNTNKLLEESRYSQKINDFVSNVNNNQYANIQYLKSKAYDILTKDEDFQLLYEVFYSQQKKNLILQHIQSFTQCENSQTTVQTPQQLQQRYQQYFSKKIKFLLVQIIFNIITYFSNINQQQLFF